MQDTRRGPDLPDVDPGALLRRFAERHGEKIELAATLPQLHRTVLDRERARLARKLGGDHPRVKAMADRVARSAAVARDVDAVAGLRHMKRGRPAENEFLVHGRLTDQHGRPMEKARVALVDAQEKVLDVPAVTSDTAGYYALTLPREKLETLREKGARIAVVDARNKSLRVADDVVDPDRPRHFESLSIPREKVQGRIILERGGAGGTGRRPPSLEDIDGIGPARAKTLKNKGIGDLGAFRKTDDARLREILGDRDIAGMKRQAGEIVRKRDRGS